MKLHFLTKSTATFVLAGVTAILTPSAYADTVNISFDSLSVAPGGYVSGAPVTSYLAGYGITLSGMLPGEVAVVLYAPTYMDVPSSPNVFTVWGANPATVTLNFSTLIDNFSFDRVGTFAAYSPSGTTRGPWSATAYNASNSILGTVGEGYIGTFSDLPTKTFTLAATGIDHIYFTGNHLGFAGSNMPIMDNYSFTTPVPEPETYAMLLAGLGLLGFAARRRKLKEAAAA